MIKRLGKKGMGKFVISTWDDEFLNFGVSSKSKAQTEAIILYGMMMQKLGLLNFVAKPYNRNPEHSILGYVRTMGDEAVKFVFTTSGSIDDLERLCAPMLAFDNVRAIDVNAPKAGLLVDRDFFESSTGLSDNWINTIQGLFSNVAGLIQG